MGAVKMIWKSSCRIELYAQVNYHSAFWQSPSSEESLRPTHVNATAWEGVSYRACGFQLSKARCVWIQIHVF